MSDREEKKPRLEKIVDASEYKQKDTAINKLIKAFIPDNIYDLTEFRRFQNGIKEKSNSKKWYRNRIP